MIPLTTNGSKCLHVMDSMEGQIHFKDLLFVSHCFEILTVSDSSSLRDRGDPGIVDIIIII